MTTITPTSINTQIQTLCLKLAPESTPVYVDVVPEPDTTIDNCFINVRRKVSTDGGSILHGWIIWDFVDVLVEAEFHAIWVSPEGAFLDITPKIDKEQKILFLPDYHKQWIGKYVDNVRYPRLVTQLSKDLDAASARLVLELNSQSKNHSIIQHILALKELKLSIGILLSRGGDIDSLCPCGSNRKYKNCHRKILYR